MRPFLLAVERVTHLLLAGDGTLGVTVTAVDADNYASSLEVDLLGGQVAYLNITATGTISIPLKQLGTGPYRRSPPVFADLLPRRGDL